MSFDIRDPSFNSTGYDGHVRNWCGYLGSFFSDILYQGFGAGAWLFVLMLAHFAISSLLKKNTDTASQRAPWAVLMIFTVCGLLGLHFSQILIAQQIPISGAIGLGISKTFVMGLNRSGTAIVLWSLLMVLTIAYTQKNLEELLKVFTSPLVVILNRALVPAYSYAGLAFRQGAQIKVPSFKKPVERASPQATNAEPHGEPLFLLNQTDIEEEPIELSFSDSNERKDVEIPKVNRKKFVPKVQLQIENWELPKLSLLKDPPLTRAKVDERELRQVTAMLEDKLSQFSVKGQVVAVRPGPAVTLFEFKPNADVKISKITELADDLALALSAESVRIIAPVPGRDVVGIETSNTQREKVYLKDILTDSAFWDEKIKLPVVLGQQANGEARVVDLRRMPHLLVAGTTGSGKSVFVVSILTGLLFRHSPKTLRLILIDPKQVDLAAFEKIPHLLMPPIREPKKAVNALKWAISEMEKRYRSMSRFGARGLEEFNQVTGSLSKAQKEIYDQENHELELQSPQRTYYFTPLPYIAIVVEEFGDLMSVDKVNVEQGVVRLAQMARACGIHLVLAMQSPRKDVITGLIKTNIPGRISFKVASKMDSRIVLDESGAERLLANGDMLFLAPGVAKPERHHGAWLTEEEITGVCSYWSNQAEPEFDDSVLRAVENREDDHGGYFEDELNPDAEDRYDEILEYVSLQKEVSASLLQRKFRLGYPRAARLIEIFEKEGVVGPPNGSKPRQVLVHRAEA